ncbi:AraC family transcriptional regulator [Sphingobium sp. H39-3-25]|uniref:AraC family transcriptional regulator n=1 Tax=Sphingobium arseniciresistens TaxID=3030834 RepID=UPI0023BA2CEC|nr:AraC family transcriptional regulator [Sphingobium arseniciresistens]
MDYGFEDLGALDGGVRPFVHGALQAPFHWHEHMEVLMVVRGRARMIVDGQECELCAGDLMIINAQSPHNSISQDRDTIMCGVHIDASHAERQGLTGFAGRYFLCKSFLSARHFYDDVIVPMRASIARLLLSTGKPEDTMLRNCLAGLLCYHIHKHVPFEERRQMPVGQGSGSSVIMRIMREMRDIKDARLSLDYFAKRERLSVTHLSRMFRRHSGLCFRDYAQNLRLDRTVEQLRDSDLSILDIALDEGFSSGSHFYAKFRERFGCTPLEYRQRRNTAEAPVEAPLLSTYRPLLLELARDNDMFLRELTDMSASPDLVTVCALHSGTAALH